MKRVLAGFVAVFALATLACDRPAQARSAHDEDAVKAPAALKVDSILPSGEALRRFQSELAPVSELTGAARNRNELVARFVRAVESGDTAALRVLHVSKAEYAFLYFPSSAYSRPPYELPPDIAWLLSEQNSRKGLIRLARRLGGKKLGVRGNECSDAVTEWENRFWRRCQVSYIDLTSRQPAKRQLFGAIIERDGRYKFLSYANDF